MQIPVIPAIFLAILNISIIDGVTKCPHCVEVEFWLTKMGLGTVSENQLGRQFACALCEQQQLLEALYESRNGNINYDALMNSSAFSKRISQLKNRMEFIRENDPEMAQLFEELISAEIQAKRAFHNKDPNFDSMLIPLKDKLFNAVHFIAKRQQISATEIAPLKGIDMQEVVKELIELKNQVESNEHENGHSKKGERCDEEHYSREKRMLQLVITSIGEGEGMSKSPSKDRRRRRKRLNIYWTIVIIGCCVIWLCACIYNGCLRKRPNQQNSEQTHPSDSHVVNMGN